MAELSLSVVLVSFHSRGDLEVCLPSLYAQQVEDLELIVVDNAPGDGTAAWLAEAHPEVQVLSAPGNLGYAGGCNLGLGAARGELVLLLNPDTKLEPGALRALMEAAAAHPNALITPKLLGPDGTVNACGLELHTSGIATCRGLGRDPAEFAGLHSVPLASGAAIMARRSLLLDLGGMDAAYFMYLEDVDLSLRARLRGYEVLCEAGAVLRHDYALAVTPRKFHLLERNRSMTLFKLYRAPSLVRLGPALLLTELATWFYAAMRGPRYLLAKLEGYAWLWRHRHGWLEQRARIQATRRVGDAALLAHCTSRLPLAQLMGGARLGEWLERLTGPLYRLVRPRVGEVGL